MPQIIPQQSWTDPISGAMQFEINENAKRSSEQERSRSQQNQPTNQPNVERLIGPETTEAEFRFQLLRPIEPGKRLLAKRFGLHLMA